MGRFESECSVFRFVFTEFSDLVVRLLHSIGGQTQYYNVSVILFYVFQNRSCKYSRKTEAHLNNFQYLVDSILLLGIWLDLDAL